MYTRTLYIVTRAGLEPACFTADGLKPSMYTNFIISPKPPLLRAKGKTKKICEPGRT